MSRAEVEAHIRAHPVEGTVEEMRAAFAALAGAGPEGRRAKIGGVEAVCHGEGAPLLWLHGGGLVFGSPETHARLGDFLARAARATVILPRYRLAPEAPWPAPLEDVLAVLDTFDGPVTVCGDSAGGQLALLAALHRPGKVARLALVSPNTDRTGCSLTREANAEGDLMNDPATDARLNDLAQGSLPPGDPDRSPLLADLAGLPPTFLTASQGEVLFDDARLLSEELVKAGVTLTNQWEADLFHMWVLWPEALPEARATLDAIAAFHLTKNPVRPFIRPKSVELARESA